MMTDNEDAVVFEDRRFRVVQCLDVDVPGYLIVELRNAPDRWADLTEDQRNGLGALLARTAAAIETALSPERVYVCAFGEGTATVHFHVFPRYAWMAGAFRDETGRDDLDGPALLSLIRRRHACTPRGWKDLERIRAAVRSIREHLAE